jgi:hypothetical protein
MSFYAEPDGRVKSNRVLWSNIVDVPVSVTYLEQVEIDFGTTPIEEKSFSITNTSITATSVIMAQIAYVVPTGKELDELEFDSFDFRCVAGAGSFTLYARSLEGLVADKFVINYSFCNS